MWGVIIIKHYKDPYYTISTVESKACFFFFFSWLNWPLNEDVFSYEGNLEQGGLTYDERMK